MKRKQNKFRVITNREGAVFTFKHDLNLHVLGDLHIGHQNCDYELLEKAVNSIKKDPNARCFINGDLAEYIPPAYKIPQTEQELKGEEQIARVIEILKPIREKILWITRGNHLGMRSIKIAGIDMVKIIAQALEVPYYPVGGFSKFTVGTEVYIGASAHGKSGAANGDTELERMRRLYVGADWYVLNHNHQLYAKPVDMLSFENKEHLKEVWFIRGGSFVKLPEYAREALYPVVRTGWIEIQMSKEGKLDCIKHSEV